MDSKRKELKNKDSLNKNYQCINRKFQVNTKNLSPNFKKIDKLSLTPERNTERKKSLFNPFQNNLKNEILNDKIDEGIKIEKNDENICKKSMDANENNDKKLTIITKTRKFKRPSFQVITKIETKSKEIKQISECKWSSKTRKFNDKSKIEQIKNPEKIDNSSTTPNRSNSVNNSSVFKTPNSILHNESSKNQSKMLKTPPMCQCGRRSRRKKVQTPGPNIGRNFYCCPFGRRNSGSSDGCNFFAWEGEEKSTKMKSDSTYNYSTREEFISPEIKRIKINSINDKTIHGIQPNENKEKSEENVFKPVIVYSVKNQQQKNLLNNPFL